MHLLCCFTCLLSNSFWFNFFCTMSIIATKETKLIIVVDDFHFEIKYVAFEGKVISRYGTFNRIANKDM